MKTLYAYKSVESRLSGVELAQLVLERIFEEEPKAWEVDEFLVVANVWPWDRKGEN